MEDYSFVYNCHIKKRSDDASLYLFKQLENGHIIAALNGYAIIPLEEYNELIGVKHDDSHITKTNTEIMETINGD